MTDKDRSSDAASDQPTIPPGKDRDSQKNSGTGTDYDKLNVRDASGSSTGSGMQTDRTLGSVGGGTTPASAGGSGAPRDGVNTSDSTVESGGTTVGSRVGTGSTTDRGSMPIGDMTTQSSDIQQRLAGDTATGTTTGGQSTSTSQTTGGQDSTNASGHKGSRPLSREEADRINQDARTNSGPPRPDDLGNQPR